MCGPGHHSSHKALSILMVAVCLFLLAGTVIPLGLTIGMVLPVGFWHPPARGTSAGFLVCVHTVYLYGSPLFSCSDPVQRLVLLWTSPFSLQLVLGSLSMPERMLACRPTGLGMMYALSWDAGSVWATDDAAQMRKYGKE